MNRQLIAALVQGDDKQALALVEAGADLNTRYTPTPVPSLPELVRQSLHRMPPNGNDSPTAFLIACGAPWSDDFTMWETQTHRPDEPQLVQIMLRQGVNINARDSYGKTPLLWAINGNHRSTAVVLLKYHADVNAPDDNGMTPLMAACQFHDAEMPRLLLHYGANVNAKNKGGGTALTGANGCSETVRLLLESGADVDASNQGGMTPLYYYVGRDASLDAVNVLLEHGADVNKQDIYGDSPLYEAVLEHLLPSNDYTAKDILRRLLVHGANPNLPDKNGDTPLKLAQREKRADIVALLNQAGARK